MVVEGNVLLTRILKPKKVISLLEVIKNQEALSRLTGALEGETCKGSITLAFDDCLLGMPEYTSFIDTTPEEKYKAVFMNESEK